MYPSRDIGNSSVKLLTNFGKGVSTKLTITFAMVTFICWNLNQNDAEIMGFHMICCNGVFVKVRVKGHRMCTLNFVFSKTDCLIFTNFVPNTCWFILFWWYKFNYGTTVGLGDMVMNVCVPQVEEQYLVYNFYSKVWLLNSDSTVDFSEAVLLSFCVNERVYLPSSGSCVCFSQYVRHGMVRVCWLLV